MENNELKKYHGSQIIYFEVSEQEAKNGQMTALIAKNLHHEKQIPLSALVLVEGLLHRGKALVSILWSDRELVAPPAVAIGTMKRYSFNRWPNGVILQEVM